MDGKRRQRARVLVIDDDVTLRRLMTFGLERAGYEVWTAENGAEAKEILDSEDVDIMVIDLLMPVMDGLQFLRWLRVEARKETPALVLTSCREEEWPGASGNSGATGVIKKPVKLSELHGKIAGLLCSEVSRR